MPINIFMPALSPTMEKGNLAKWLKKEGDAVKTGDVIAEIETDKATMEYEAVDDGVMAKIVVPEGAQDVPVHQLIAVMAQEGEDPKAAAAAAAAGAPGGQGTPAVTTPSGETPSPAAGKGAEVGPQAAPPSMVAQARPPEEKSSPPPPAARAPSPQRGEGGGEGARPDGHGANRVFSSPLARRLAKDAGVDIGRIAGSGPHGRVIARDVAAAKEGKGLKAPAAAAAPAPAAAAGAPPMAQIAQTPSDEKIRALFGPGSYEVVPHDNIRRIIAQRLTLAKQTIPHFYLTIDCAIGKLLTAREEINAAAPKDKDGKPDLENLGQRFRHQGAGGRADARARCQCHLDRGRSAQAQARRRWRRGRHNRRPDHADRAAGRHEIAVGDLQRDEGLRRARARAKTQAGGIPGRHHGGVEPRHVRHQGVLRRHQPAARDHSLGRRRRGARGRAQRQDRGGADDDAWGSRPITAPSTARSAPSSCGRSRG